MANVTKLLTEPDEGPTPAQRRMAASRAALADVFAPPGEDEFPRSETMRFLMGGKGRMVALGLFTGLLLVKPKLAVGLVRFLPLGRALPIGRILQTLR
jgi:hypothetical protein